MVVLSGTELYYDASYQFGREALELAYIMVMIFTIVVANPVGRGTGL